MAPPGGAPFLVNGSSRSILPVGDSKTIADPGYVPGLLSGLDNATEFKWLESPGRLARPGYTAALWAAQIDADIAASTGIPDFVLVNIGSNDIEPLADPLVEAAWKADFAYVLDAINTAYPTAQVYVMQIWRRYNNGDITAMNDTWIPAVLSTRSTWVEVGPDERGFLEGGDDGATYTADGIHPNAAGYALTATQWQSKMGY